MQLISLNEYQNSCSLLSQSMQQNKCNYRVLSKASIGSLFLGLEAQFKHPYSQSPYKFK